MKLSASEASTVLRMAMNGGKPNKEALDAALAHHRMSHSDLVRFQREARKTEYGKPQFVICTPTSAGRRR